MKRLGIFCTYDSEGIIDDYILYLLQEMQKILSHLVIVCNGTLTAESRQKLEIYTDDILVRPNTGFDMEAWRQGILKNEAELPKYDELILFNDSFYGPFYPFTEVFAEMNKKPDADFWGLTVHGKTPDELNICPYGYIPEHLQSYFLVIRGRLLHSKEFIHYWKNSTVAENYEQAVRIYEVCFTKDFFDKGFKYDVYCDTRDSEMECDIKINHTLIATENLLKKYKCPVLKKKLFLISRAHSLHENYGDEPRKSLDFVKNHTDYDVKLIWQNLLRKQNIALTKTHLGLNYILSKEISNVDVKPIFKQVAIVAHLYYEDLISECVDYLNETPQEISIIITVSSDKKKLEVEHLFNKSERKCEVRIVQNRGRDLAALLVGCADIFKRFKYLCFIHDKKSIRPNKSTIVGKAFFRLLWENVLGSECFIRNVLATFEAEPQLGLLVPPQPYNGEYKRIFFRAKYWSGVCFEKTVELAEKLNIPEKFLDINHTPLAIGSVFWCRTEALKRVADVKWKFEDFPPEPLPDDGTISHALERIFPFAAQTEGFYTGQLMTIDFAKDEIENFIHFSFNPIVKSNTIQLLFTKSIIALKTLTKWVIPERYWYLLKPVSRLLEKIKLNALEKSEV